MLKTSKSYTVKAITKKIEQGTLVFDNAVQRGLVWDVKRSSLLIDSLIRDYPIPPFYAVVDDRKIETAKGEVSVLDCIDGKQRCNAIHSYMTDEFALKGLEPFPTEDGTFDANGLKYSELPEELQDALKDSSLLCYSFSDCTDDDIVEVMARLNNGKPLSAADITRVRAADLDGIKRLASHPLFDGAYAQKHADWCRDWLNEKCSIVADSLNNYLQGCAEYYRIYETSADGQTVEAWLFTDSSISDDAICGLVKALWEREVDAPAVLKRWDGRLQNFFVYCGGTFADVRNGLM